MNPSRAGPSRHSTSHHITSHHSTSHYITSHHIRSHHITSHHITSQHITSQHITAHHIIGQLPIRMFSLFTSSFRAHVSSIIWCLLVRDCSCRIDPDGVSVLSASAKEFTPGGGGNSALPAEGGAGLAVRGVTWPMCSSTPLIFCLYIAQPDSCFAYEYKYTPTKARCSWCTASLFHWAGEVQ